MVTLQTTRAALAALAPLALLLALSACADPPDPTRWMACGDGTYCPAETMCAEQDQALICLRLPDVCGDGRRTGSEQCDDGNRENGDGCEATCTLTPVCGDCIVSGDEECDDGNQDDGDGCFNCRRVPGASLIGPDAPGCGTPPTMDPLR
jgi:cysteine-rich repeat protein